MRIVVISIWLTNERDFPVPSDPHSCEVRHQSATMGSSISHQFTRFLEGEVHVCHCHHRYRSRQERLCCSWRLCHRQARNPDRLPPPSVPTQIANFHNTNRRTSRQKLKQERQNFRSCFNSYQRFSIKRLSLISFISPPSAPCRWQQRRHAPHQRMQRSALRRALGRCEGGVQHCLPGAAQGGAVVRLQGGQQAVVQALHAQRLGGGQARVRCCHGGRQVPGPGRVRAERMRAVHGFCGAGVPPRGVLSPYQFTRRVSTITRASTVNRAMEPTTSAVCSSCSSTYSRTYSSAMPAPNGRPRRKLPSMWLA